MRLPLEFWLGPAHNLEALAVPLLHAAAQDRDVAESSTQERPRRLHRAHLGAADKRQFVFLKPAEFCKLIRQLGQRNVSGARYVTDCPTEFLRPAHVDDDGCGNAFQLFGKFLRLNP